MPKPTFTPGPWYAQPTAGHDKHGQTAIYDDNGKDIAIVYDGDANAAVLAAAPQLYGELFRALAVIRSPQSFEVEQVCCDIDAALRAARGEK